MLAVSLIFSLSVVEIGLRVFSVVPVSGKCNRIPHPVLRYTVDPSLSDVDENGFRNPQGGGMHEIVAIGDSHTYGVNVEWEDAWPYQLGKSLGKSVYNYGVGGYGVFHYLYLAKEAIKHNPEYVILGLFPGNDIQPFTCKFISTDYYKELRKNGIVNTECFGKERLECYEQPKKVKAQVKAKNRILLTEYSALLATLEYLRVKFIKPITAEYFNNKKYFNIGGNLIKRKRALHYNYDTDLSRERVKSNFEASLTIFSLIKEELITKGIKFGVVIIPSKELVVEQWAINEGVQIPEKFLTKNVKDVFAKYLAFFEKSGIPSIDATPYVVKAFAKSEGLNEKFYPFEDSHPLVKGYESYSQAAAQLISQINLKK